jgi:D-aspartate ligase
MTPAIVLQASGPNALGLIRCLGREGVPVIACDHDPNALGLLSRYATPRVTRDPLADRDGFLADLETIGRALPGKGVLFPTHDEAIAAIGPVEDRLSQWFHRPWSPWDVMENILDKRHQHAVARSIGFPVPATVEPTSESDVIALARDLRFPVILKPGYAPEFRRRFRAQVLEAANVEELRRQWDLAAEYGPQISEVIPGGDDCLWTLGSYRGAGGEPLASFTGRKLRQWPPHFGTARAAEARWDPDLAVRGHRLLDALKFHGISQVEVKRDPRDGRDYLIEVNPRSWLWISLSAVVGVNVPLACHLDAAGTPRAWPAKHRSGVRWTLLVKHLVASAREVSRGQWTAREFAASVRPPLHDGVLSLGDRRPALAQLRRLARRG